jgi:lactate permease
MSALGLSVWGIIFTAVVACTFFHTSMVTIMLGALDGIITTFPLLLTVFFGIILSVLLIETGTLSRIVNALSRGFRDPMHMVNGICFGMGNFVAGAGIVTEPIIAPALTAVGLPAKGAAILAIWGYAGIMSFSLAGVFVVILSMVTDLDVQRLAVISAIISLVPMLVCGMAIPLVLERRDLARGRFVLNASTALVCGILVLFFVVYVSSSTASMLAGLALFGGIILLSRATPDFSAIRLIDVAPFLILIVGLSIVNIYQPFHRFANDRAIFVISVIPIHTAKIKPLMDAYTYLIIAIMAAILGLKIKRHQLYLLIESTMMRALKTIMTMVIFGAMGQIIAFTGYDVHTGSICSANNIPYVLASGVSKMSGKLYPFFAPLLGWAGTFLTGYGASSIMIFGKLQVEIAQFIDVSPAILSSAMMVGSGIGSISSPFKLAMATSLVDAVGKEGEILRKTIPLGIVIALITGMWCYLLAHML